MTTMIVEATAGERFYCQHGWSGCAGSSWDTLTDAVREGWEAAARENEKVARVLKVLEDTRNDINMSSTALWVEVNQAVHLTDLPRP